MNDVQENGTVDAPVVVRQLNEDAPDFAAGEWIHVEIGTAGEVLRVLRPPARSWHDMTDLLLAATRVVREVEQSVLVDLYTTLARLTEEKAQPEPPPHHAPKPQQQPTLRELMKRRR